MLTATHVASTYMCRSKFFFFQAEDGIRDVAVTGVQTCALPISFSFPQPEGPSWLEILPSPAVTGAGRFRARAVLSILLLTGLLAGPVAWLSTIPLVRRGCMATPHEAAADDPGRRDVVLAPWGRDARRRTMEVV